MGEANPRRLVLDTGALLAIERNTREGDRRLVALVHTAAEVGRPPIIPATVLAQAWRSGRQVRLFRLLNLAEDEHLDARSARLVGALCASSGTSDVVDASVIVCARRHGAVVVTSDSPDLARLDPEIPLLPC